MLSRLCESTFSFRWAPFDDCPPCSPQLLHNFPVDYVDSSGMKFWSGPKRAPEALVFDASDPAHLSFIASAAQILANSYGVTLPEGG